MTSSATNGPTLTTWRDDGFLLPPRLEHTSGSERWYRVSGGSSARVPMPGQRMFFSLDRPRSRRDAEARFAIAEWGNALLWLSEFRPPAGIPYWRGVVDPGQAFGWAAHAGRVSQLLVPAEAAFRVKELTCHRLLDDMNGLWVAPRRRQMNL